MNVRKLGATWGLLSSLSRIGIKRSLRIYSIEKRVYYEEIMNNPNSNCLFVKEMHINNQLNEVLKNQESFWV